MKLNEILVVLCICCLTVLNATSANSDTLSLQKDELISIVAVGDFMPGTNYPSKKYLPPNNGRDLVTDEIAAILRSGDITIGNLEGVIADRGEKSKRKKSKFLFRIPTSIATIFPELGFDLLSIANNHVGDFGDAGIDLTTNFLDSVQIGYAGIDSCSYVITKEKGKKIGFIAFAPNRRCNDLIEISKAVALVEELANEVDIIIASMHIGGESKEFSHITRESELYLGERRGNPYEFAHSIIDAGADLIIGHGPHQPRAVELYKDRLIAYSLGNFCTWGRFSFKNIRASYAPILKVDLNNDGSFNAGEIVSAKQWYNYGPKLDANNSAFKVIKKLTLADFPEMKLTLDNNRIEIKK